MLDVITGDDDRVSRSILGWLMEAWDDPTRSLSTYPGQNIKETPHLRLIRSLSHQQEGTAKIGPADIVTLLRNILVYEEISLPLPDILKRMRIDASLWQAASIDLNANQPDENRLMANPWRPEWLVADEALSLEDLLRKPEVRRSDKIVKPADPMIENMGFSHYQSEAQREALRTVLTAPSGSTIVINLPTGSGKSLCALVPALMPMSDDSGLLGVSVIIVPTVALALDLASKIEPILQHPVAYRPEDKDSASEAKHRCRAGTQGPILVSPESFVGSLRPALREAASHGFLRYLVVDEAHMVTAWGDDFRPAFQQIAGLRNELLKLAKSHSFITLLMSATLTPYHINTLEELFGQPGPLHHVHAVRLRPEPSYWFVQARSEAEREIFLLDAIFHLPRPLILYTVRKSQAEYWIRLLNKKGFHRIGLFHGETRNEQRRDLIKRWNGDKLDIMVATSAFGLGVDKPNIRCILHAALPEGLDRFYQEVGRGGRDGFASISLLVWRKQDWRDAGGLLTPTFITGDRGRERWEAMFFSDDTKWLGDNRVAVPINVPPTMRHNDIDMDSELNRSWNIKTLLLMVRTGIIEWDDLGTQESANGKEQDSNLIAVKLLNPNHLGTQVWKTTIDNRRAELYQEARKTRKLLEQLLKLNSGDTCFSHLLQKCYQTYSTPVVSSCGGCPSCRNNNILTFCGKLIPRHTPNSVWPSLPIEEGLREFLKLGKVGLIFYPGQDPDEITMESFEYLSQWLIDQGIINFVSPPFIVDRLSTIFRRNPQSRVFLHSSHPTDITRSQPTAYFVSGIELESKLWLNLKVPQNVMIVVLSEDTRQPGHPFRWVRDVLIEPAKMTLEQWREEYLL